MRLPHDVPPAQRGSSATHGPRSRLASPWDRPARQPRAGADCDKSSDARPQRSGHGGSGLWPRLPPIEARSGARDGPVSATGLQGLAPERASTPCPRSVGIADQHAHTQPRQRAEFRGAPPPGQALPAGPQPSRHSRRAGQPRPARTWRSGGSAPRASTTAGLPASRRSRRARQPSPRLPPPLADAPERQDRVNGYAQGVLHQ
jgi:hypothetical protein